MGETLWTANVGCVDCSLCHAHVDLWDLDPDGYLGLPAHSWCARSARAAADAAWDDAVAMVRAARARKREARRASAA